MHTCRTLGTPGKAGVNKLLYTHILHHSQQDQKNRVSKRKIKVLRLRDFKKPGF